MPAGAKVPDSTAIVLSHFNDVCEANQAFFGTFLGHWSRPSPEIGTFSQPLKDLKLTMKLLIENTWDSSGEKRSEGLCR